MSGKGIDLVIIGTHGRKGMDRILLGSIADRVIKSALVPVLSVNPYGAIEQLADMVSPRNRLP